MVTSNFRHHDCFFTTTDGQQKMDKSTRDLQNLTPWGRAQEIYVLTSLPGDSYVC